MKTKSRQPPQIVQQPAPARAQMAPPTPASAPTLPQIERMPDLVDRIFDYLIETLPPDVAEEIKNAGLRDDARSEIGAGYGWVYSASQTARQQRVREVLRLFNGRNATEVARRLNLSKATVYRYIKQPGR